MIQWIWLKNFEDGNFAVIGQETDEDGASDGAYEGGADDN